MGVANPSDGKRNDLMRHFAISPTPARFWTNLVLFYLFFTMCFTFGYRTLYLYNPDPNPKLDYGAYYKMTLRNYAEVRPPFRYRVLTPTLASAMVPVLRRLPLRMWDPVFTSLLLVNAVFISAAALLVIRIARQLGADAMAALLAPLVMLPSFAIVNYHMIALVDASELFFVSAIVLATLRKKWPLLVPLLAVGALAKESVVLLGIVFCMMDWLQSRPRRKAVLTWIVAAGVAAAMVLLAVKWSLGGGMYEPRRFTAGAVARILPGIFAYFFSRSFLYYFGFLLPIGLLGLRRLPAHYVWATAASGLAVLVACAYQGSAGDSGRPLFNAIGPMLAIGSGVWLRGLVSPEPDENLREFSQADQAREEAASRTS